MLSERLTIANVTGLHARPAAWLVDCASRFKSDVSLIAGVTCIDAKDILSVLGSGFSAGTEVDLVVEGEDEGPAFAAVSACLRNLPD